MSKPIEERIKVIVEENETLNIREKSEIICLIECYKGADKLAQDSVKENEKLKAAIKTAIELIEYEPDLYYLVEVLKTGVKDEKK